MPGGEFTSTDQAGLTRRRFLADGVSVAAGGRSRMRLPDSRPYEALAAGTDTMPAIDHAVNAIGNSPAWLRMLLIVTYDGHGGYFDHLPPPVALAPDGIAPMVQPGESVYDGFARYGFPSRRSWSAPTPSPTTSATWSALNCPCSPPRESAATLACAKAGAGPIPPPRPAPLSATLPAIRLELGDLGRGGSARAGDRARPRPHARNRG